MNLLQLSPSIPLLTPKGPARALVLIDYGEDHDLLWVCFQDQGGECWTWRNRDIRAVPNLTFGVTSSTPPVHQSRGANGSSS